MPKNQTFRTDFGMYALHIIMCGIPLIVLVIFAISAGIDSPEARQIFAPDNVAWALFFPAAAATWLARYRLIFDDSCVRYRSWQLHEDVIPYPEIASVTISKATPIEKYPVSTHVNLKSGGYVIIYTKAFSREATKNLYSLNSSEQGSNNSFKPKPLRGSA